MFARDCRALESSLRERVSESIKYSSTEFYRVSTSGNGLVLMFRFVRHRLLFGLLLFLPLTCSRVIAEPYRVSFIPIFFGDFQVFGRVLPGVAEFLPRLRHGLPRLLVGSITRRCTRLIFTGFYPVLPSQIDFKGGSVNHLGSGFNPVRSSSFFLFGTFSLHKPPLLERVGEINKPNERNEKKERERQPNKDR